MLFLEIMFIIGLILGMSYFLGLTEKVGGKVLGFILGSLGLVYIGTLIKLGFFITDLIIK